MVKVQWSQLCVTYSFKLGWNQVEVQWECWAVRYGVKTFYIFYCNYVEG